MEDRKLNSLIGLCQKSGNLVSGGFLSLGSVRSRKSKLVILAKDASENTKKKFRDKCSFYKIAIYEYSNMEALGHIVGKEDRTVISIEDGGLAKAIKNRIEEITRAMDK